MCHSDFTSPSCMVKWPWVKHFPVISFGLQVEAEMDSGHQSSRNNLPWGLWMKMTANTMGTHEAILSFLKILIHWRVITRQGKEAVSPLFYRKAARPQPACGRAGSWTRYPLPSYLSLVFVELFMQDSFWGCCMDPRNLSCTWQKLQCRDSVWEQMKLPPVSAGRFLQLI